jgi:ribose transport system permease protein
MKALREPWVRALVARLLVVALGILFNADGAFFKLETQRDMLRDISRIAILACGMTVVILAAGIDLSVGSVLALSAVTFATLSIHQGWSVWTAIPATLAVGLACGLLSGGLVARLRLQPFVATLAMMVLARGLAKAVSGGQKVSTAVQQADGSYSYVSAPPIFELLGGRVLGDSVAVVSLVFLACVGVAWVLLARLRWGRYVYAVGGNEEAARLAGVPVTGVKLMAYGLCGLFAAVAGICQAAEELQGDSEAGFTYELTAIAIVVIGGTHLMGGRGGVGLTLLGALTIGTLEKILSINAVPESGRLVLTGVILIAAVLFQKVRR